MLNGPSQYKYFLLRRPVGMQDKFDWTVVLAFFSTKVVRGGPRTIVHLTTCLALLLLLIKLLPHRLTDVNQSLWGWQDADEDLRSGEESDGSVPGGLRIVVFGENDIASPARLSGRGIVGTDSRSWTEVLCQELGCSSYLSFIPSFDLPSTMMTSTRMYADSVDRVLNETAESGEPGFDYNFIPDQYPVAWDLPDLSEQVDAFLKMKKPLHAPAETIYVFSFGMWDIWSLASEPRDVSTTIIGSMVSHIFGEIERIYSAALDEESIAWSDPPPVLNTTVTLNRTEMSAVVPGKAGPTALEAPSINPEPTATDTAAKPSSTPYSPQSPHPTDKTKHFRIFVPKLFDPSLTPGWNSARPSAPGVHSKAEQMRNAAALTDMWNEKLINIMAGWIRTPNPLPVTDAETPNEDFVAGFVDKLAEVVDGQDVRQEMKDRILAGQYHVRPPSRGIERREVGGQSATETDKVPELEAKEKRKRGRTTDMLLGGQNHIIPPPPIDVTVADVGPVEGAYGPEPMRWPQRDAFLYDLPNYLAEVIVDRQFRKVGLQDHRGVGTMPTEKGFLEVWKPCVDEVVEDVANDGLDTTHEEEVEWEEGEDVPSLAIRGRTPAAVDSFSPAVNRGSLSICDAPHEHLFYTPFTVSPRAAAAIASQAADMVRGNETVRAHWAKIRVQPLKFYVVCVVGVDCPI